MEIKQKLEELGLTHAEINGLGIENAINYIRFHHGKYYGESSVLFSKISSDRLSKLHILSNSCGIKISSKISRGLTFFCFENEKDDRINKAKDYGVKLLSPNEFEGIFSIREYNLNKCDAIFNKSVKDVFRIAKPLSNFDETKEINSFSFDSEKVYNVNLFKQTCTCSDFIQTNRSNYKCGDIRRLCKHLMKEYSNSFGTYSLSILQKGMLNNGHSVKHNLDKINIDSLKLPIYINRDNYSENQNNWWNIYASLDNVSYIRYGFLPKEERFSYDDKPYGHVKELREKLKSFNKTVTPIKNTTTVRNTTAVQNTTGNLGCAGVLLIPVISIILYALLS